VSIDLGPIGEQWPLLPPEMRERRVAELARRLSNAVREAPGPSSRNRSGDPAASSSPLRTVAIIAAAAVVLIGAGAFGYRRIFSSSSATGERVGPANQPIETVQQADARHARLCDAVRKRVYAGASVGPFEIDGWVAEIWVASSRPGADLRGHAAFDGWIKNGKLLPDADATLAAIPDGTAEIAEGQSAEDASKSPAWKSVTLRLGGKYASALFDPQVRPRMIAFADRVAETTSAEMGAMYGRCAHVPYHDVGAWFRGTDSGAAGAALLYRIGFFAELAVVNRTQVAALGPSELDGLRASVSKVNPDTLLALLGSSGGTVTTSPSGAVTIAFSVAAGARAIGASRNLAERIGVGASAAE
jgi:serine/threonine-protein kinase